ncbi:MAG: O-antigen ligase family protein [Gammaproteobacteria bacterium]|nr:O-antigen ligase family protein [Gammaproteobacteria bacterium]
MTDTHSKQPAALNKQKIGQCLVWLIIVGPAFIDWAHGFLATEFDIDILASAYRMLLILAGLLLLITKPRWSIIVATMIYFAFLLFEFTSWSMFSRIYILDELVSSLSLFLFIFCYILISFTVRYLNVSYEFIIDQVLSYGKITSVIIVLSLIFQIGIPTYSSSAGVIYGFGTQSYYIAANVLGLSLVVSLAAAVYRFVKDFRPRFFFDALLIFAGAFCVGSRTGMLVSVILLAAAVLYFIFFSSGRMRYRLALSVIFIPLFVYGGFKTYEMVSQHSRMLMKLEALYSGEIRGEHASSARDYLATQDLASRVAGDSYQVYTRRFAQYSPKKRVETATAEQDPLDIIGAYGIVGLVLLYLPYAMGILISGLNWILTRQPHYPIACISLMLFLGHSVIAGHVLMSSKATQFASIFIVLALSSARQARGSPDRPGAHA